MKKKVILDVDTGSDDAIAIIFAALHPKIDLLGICTVNGNRNINITTENTLRVVDLLKSDIPVYRGCYIPMVVSLAEGRRKHVPFVGPERPEDDVHGDYLPLPTAISKAKEDHAVNWIIKTLHESDKPLILCCVGPLTNLAMALRLAPDIVSKIDEIVIMGGGYEINNVTSGAEFNFWIDPEAAKIVADCGAPMRIVPLDATHDAYITLDEANSLIAMNSDTARFCGNLARKRIQGYSTFQPLPVAESAPIHDALAVAAIVDPTVLTNVHNVNMDVICAPGATDGMSLFDFGHRNCDRRNNCEVALSADRERFINLLIETISK